jgi:non-heme chloroperoxidase
VKRSRLARDLYELLTDLDLNEVVLLGHSMGSSVIWCYFDLFGPERLSKIILVDQSPFLTSDPHWTQQELADSGAIFTAQQVFDRVAALRSKEAEQVTRKIIGELMKPSESRSTSAKPFGFGHAKVGAITSRLCSLVLDPQGLQ